MQVITPPITGRLTGRAELNKIMLHQERGPKGTRFKIHRNLQRQTGLAFEAKAFCCSWRHFLSPMFLRRKLHFQNILGVYKVVGFPLKEKWQGKQHLEVTEWKIKHESHSKSVFCGLFRAKAKRLPRRYSAPSRMGSGPGFETARLRSAEKHRKSTMLCKMN